MTEELTVPSYKTELPVFVMSKPVNKRKEPLALVVVRAWTRRHVENGNTVIIEDRPDSNEFAFYADDLTLCRVDIFWDQIKTKGIP